MACLWARAGDGPRAKRNLDLLLRTCTTPNLFTWHNDWRSQGLSLFWGHGALPPFQIEAGMGLVAAVCEMLVRHRPGHLHLLPALPAEWPRGQVRGLTTRCGVTIDMVWAEGGHRIEAVLHATVAVRLQLTLPGPDSEGRSRLDLDIPAGTSAHAFDLRPAPGKRHVGLAD